MSLFRKLSRRGAIAYGHDIVMAALSFVIALYLRLGGDVFQPEYRDLLVEGTLLFTVIAATVFMFSGLYRGIWRYASLDDLLAITRAASLVVLVFLALMFLKTRLEVLPRSMVIIDWFVLMALLGGPRFVYRLTKDRHFDFRRAAGKGARVPVLLAGAGDGTEMFLRALARDGNSPYHPVGIVSERAEQVGRRIHGVEVLGTTADLADVVARLKALGNAPQRLVLTREYPEGARVRALLEAGTAVGLSLARLPRMTELRTGVGEKVDVRPVAIEDLLGRPQTPLDRQSMRAFIVGRRVLITGAGGSIGSELVRQVAGFDPAELILLDSSEFNLYEIDHEVGRRWPKLARRAVLADVRERERIRRLFASARPEIVFHAAALKHVPLVEANPIQGLSINVLGTASVADAAAEAGARAMVQISTDKAVNPASVMGASKRIAEMYCQSLDLARAGADGTRFVTVRFGNVLGSTGSVVPLFQRQLDEGGPLTVTHPEMTRYFMTVREAVELVIEASALAGRNAGTEGKIFVLDMGEPVKIVDLAQQMIRLAGLRPDQDVKIVFTGPRPGEKLREALFHGAEPPLATAHPGLLLAAPRAARREELTQAIAELAAACGRDDAAAAIAVMTRLVPEYAPEAPAGVRAAAS